MKKTTNKATIKRSYGANAKAVPNKVYRLPNGKTTTSHAKYLKDWKKIGDDFGTIIGGDLFGFDPDLVYRVDGNSNSETFSPITVMKILQTIRDAEMKGYEDGRRCARDYDFTYY